MDEYDGIDLSKAAVNQENVNRLNAQIRKIRFEMEELTDKISNLDEMIPMVHYSNGDGFGEKSLCSDQPRAGTAVTAADTHFAVVTKESYKKLLMKSEQVARQEMVAFMRQIPFLTKWKQRDLISLEYFLAIEKIENRGQYVFKEGEECQRFIIIKSGEFEIVKTNLRNIYYNTVSGIVGIKEDNNSGKIVRSTNPIASNVPMVEDQLGKISSHQYVGTEF